MNKYLVISIVMLFSDLISAQDATVKTFVPNGDPIVRIFANVHSGLTKTDPSKAFEVRRAYLGYKYRLSEHFTTEIKVDIGNPEEISEFARLRRYAKAIRTCRMTMHSNTAALFLISRSVVYN